MRTGRRDLTFLYHKCAPGTTSRTEPHGPTPHLAVVEHLTTGDDGKEVLERDTAFLNRLGTMLGVGEHRCRGCNVPISEENRKAASVIMKLLRLENA